ncbi:MAG: NRDE family protein [Gammaproteobacteria bacterium]|nr:NRDE family protein [Gammaproteobacteria bacterium]
MCLILLAWQADPRYSLVVAANRDEFYRRPTRPADYWPEDPALLAGKDLQAGGTWLGVNRAGRFAAVTNRRQADRKSEPGPSRGLLVKGFLAGADEPTAYLEQIKSKSEPASGFNLLLANGAGLHYSNDLEPHSQALTPGIHGLSNAELNTPWPKVERGKRRLAAALDQPDPLPRLFQLLTDRESAPDHALPDTGIGLEWERSLSPSFIHRGDYGTRCSTVILVRTTGEMLFVERSYREGDPTRYAEQRFELQIDKQD